MKYAMTAVLITAAAAAFAAAPAADKPGQKLFETKCAACHNKDAKGKPAMAKMFKIDASALDLTKADTQKKSDADLAKVVTDGRNKMPIFKGKLKDAEISSVVSYVRTLQPAAK